MTDILVLLVLLSAHTTKVYSHPYPAHSEGKCRSPDTEYVPDSSNRCCKKCPPGQRQIQECNETTETVCAPCEQGQYMESWNYAPNCFTCPKCKPQKGLQYAENCSSITKAKCECQSGWYCAMAFDDPYCSSCLKYTLCKQGYGVSVPGTATSNVKCERCPEGTFSDTRSYTDRCRPHRNCYGNAFVRNGSDTSDAVCVYENVTSTQSPLNVDTTSPLPVSTWNTILPCTLGLLGGVCGFIFIVITLVCLCKRKEPERDRPKVDANGNCETADKVNQGFGGEKQMTSLTVTSPEQHCLLVKGEGCCDNSQTGNHTEALTRTDSFCSHDCIGPSPSPRAFNNSYSALSEPMPLISNTESVTPPSSAHFQSSSQASSQSSSQASSQASSQPTSPQIISPTSPHVNVNITVHIKNGSCGTPPVMPIDLREADCKLPFGEEEESFSIPQQEDGKQSLMTVEDSAIYSV